MILIGPLLMFAGLILAAIIGDHRQLHPLDEERAMRELQALEDQAAEERDLEDREREQGSDSWALGEIRAGGYS